MIFQHGVQVLVYNSYFYPTLEKMKKLRHVVLHGVCDNQVIVKDFPNQFFSFVTIS
jgi:hypothetical protein